MKYKTCSHLKIPASVHSLWSSPKFLNRFCLTILIRLRFSRLVVHLFLPHFFLPLNFLLTCLDTALCEQPASLAMNVCGLPSLWRVSIATFTWTLFASIRMNSFWLSNPNIVFTWTPNKVIGLMWAFIRHELLIGFNLLTCAHCMNIQFPAVVTYGFKKHTWYLFTSGPN